MSLPNHAPHPYEQPAAAHEMQQPNNFINQQPLPGQMNATPPPMQQQQPQAFQPYAQQAHYPPIPNAQQQPQPMPQYAPAPPLAQGQEPATPIDNGHAAARSAGGKDRKGRLVRAKLQFKDRNMWVDGESIVGRKGRRRRVERGEGV
ncbi:hypothetical protein Q7P35_007626 [Cladosporium inversicolor]